MSELDEFPQSQNLIPEEMPQGTADEIEAPWYAGNRILSWLYDTRLPMGAYVLRAGLLSLLPSLVVAFFVSLAGATQQGALPQFDEEHGRALLLVSVVVLSPVIESLLMGLGLWLISRVVPKVFWQAVISCLVWGVLHSLAAPAWGVVVAWPFFVFSSAYLAWRGRSWWHAVGAATGIHMFQNLLPGLVIAFV